MNNDPQDILDNSLMTATQVTAIAMCILLNALDGFDVLSISFAAPGISSEWGINRAALGLVLSMELIGMAAGSIILGKLADKIGRRPTILGCLVLMSAGMLAAGLAASVTELSVFRFITGLGIGGMLAAINAMAAEFSNAKHRNMAVMLMAGGYPLGAVVGGASLGLLSHRFSVRAMVMVVLLGGAIMVSVFGGGQEDLSQLATIAAITGFFITSAIIGMYALFAQAFPTEIRAGGTGFVIGLGRGGAALGPIVAGLMFSIGYGLQPVALIMASGSLVAVVALFFLKSVDNTHLGDKPKHV